MATLPFVAYSQTLAGRAQSGLRPFSPSISVRLDALVMQSSMSNSSTYSPGPPPSFGHFSTDTPFESVTKTPSLASSLRSGSWRRPGPCHDLLRDLRRAGSAKDAGQAPRDRTDHGTDRVEEARAAVPAEAPKNPAIWFGRNSPPF